ncbi:MAG: hypothetical protein GY832_03815 [Chloroflexi bacterium]|nr:hypothetical protein [Chloroflexota bacterium]
MKIERRWKLPLFDVRYLLHGRWTGPSLGIRSRILGFAVKIPVRQGSLFDTLLQALQI